MKKRKLEKLSKNEIFRRLFVQTLIDELEPADICDLDRYGNYIEEIESEDSFATFSDIIRNKATPEALTKKLESLPQKIQKRILKICPRDVKTNMYSLVNYFTNFEVIERRIEESKVCKLITPANFDQEINCVMFSILLPIDVVRIIFEYSINGKNLLYGICFTNYDWYKAVLYSWREVFITKQNIHDLPISILKYARVKLTFKDELESEDIIKIMNVVRENKSCCSIDLSRIFTNRFLNYSIFLGLELSMKKIYDAFKKTNSLNITKFVLPTCNRDYSDTFHSSVITMSDGYKFPKNTKPRICFKNLVELCNANPTDLFNFDTTKLKTLHLIFEEYYCLRDWNEKKFPNVSKLSVDINQKLTTEPEVHMSFINNCFPALRSLSIKYCDIYVDGLYNFIFSKLIDLEYLRFEEDCILLGYDHNENFYLNKNIRSFHLITYRGLSFDASMMISNLDSFVWRVKCKISKKIGKCIGKILRVSGCCKKKIEIICSDRSAVNFNGKRIMITATKHKKINVLLRHTLTSVVVMNEIGKTLKEVVIKKLRKQEKITLNSTKRLSQLLKKKKLVFLREEGFGREITKSFYKYTGK